MQVSRPCAWIHRTTQEAVDKKKLMVVIIDDYTNIHTRRRCDSNQQMNISHMATVLVRIFDLSAVSLHSLHPNMPGGINIHLLQTEFQTNMHIFFSTFATTAPAILTQQFFDLESEHLCLTTHMYGEDNNVRQIRGVVNAF